MRSPARAVIVLVVALLATIAGIGAPAQAANDKGLANGSVTCPHLSKCPGIKVQWFDRNWNFLGSKSANGGGYSLTLAPGTYHLQFVDKRPAYDTSKFAPTDIQVTVHANSLTKKNVTMRKGASITGTVRGGNGKPLKNAHVVAARTDGVSFATDANGKGQFAVGGLSEGKYSIFTFDKAKTWVDKSTWANKLTPGQSKNFAIKLKKEAGNLTVYLFQPDGLLKTKTTLSVTSKKTGQWWSATSGNGTFVFHGLYPGAYQVDFPGAGAWLPKSGGVQKASVKPGKMDFGSFHVTKRGGWLAGTVVDGGAPSYTLKDAQVLLFGESGQQLAVATSDDDGNFKVQGQITTQSVTLVVNPNPNGGGYMQGQSYCVFQHTEPPDNWQVTTGEETFVGDVSLDRAPDNEQPSDLCKSGQGRG